MSIRIRSRSYLSCLGCLGAALVIFVLLNNVYVQVRIYMAHAQAKELAQQLGYTPNDLLLSKVYAENIDIITGSAVCRTSLFFVTPLSSPDFEARLLAAQFGTRRINPLTDYLREIYSDMPLNVNGVSGREPGAETFPWIPTATWFLPGGSAMQTNIVDLYQTEQLDVTLTFGERQIDGNIAHIQWSAGRHPIWTRC